MKLGRRRPARRRVGGAVGLVGSPDDEPADAAAFDAGVRAAFHEFCDGVYPADDARMQGKCSASDFTVSQRMGKAAAKGCADDFAIALAAVRATFDAEAGRRASRC